MTRILPLLLLLTACGDYPQAEEGVEPVQESPPSIDGADDDDSADTPAPASEWIQFGATQIWYWPEMSAAGAPSGDAPWIRNEGGYDVICYVSIDDGDYSEVTMPADGETELAPSACQDGQDLGPVLAECVGAILSWWGACG